jgi:flagellar biosynthesis GTPase FlhF
MTKSILGGVLILAVAGLPVAAWAHGGGLDANGCHQNNKTGVYECHKGAHEGQIFASRADMEKGMPGRPADAKPESTRKAKEQAAETKSGRTKARADEQAEKERIAAEKKVEDVKAEKEKVDTQSKAEAKAAKKKAEAEEKAAKKKAKAEEKAAKAKAKADEKATR